MVRRRHSARKLRFFVGRYEKMANDFVLNASSVHLSTCSNNSRSSSSLYKLNVVVIGTALISFKCPWTKWTSTINVRIRSEAASRVWVEMERFKHGKIMFNLDQMISNQISTLAINLFNFICEMNYPFAIYPWFVTQLTSCHTLSQLKIL